jgi:multidrug efflux system outer membrane protein
MTVLQARLNVSDAELTLENAKASYEKAVWEFSDLIGIALDPDTLTLDSFPDVENLAYDRLGDIVDSKVMDTVSVKSAQLSLERTRITVKNTWNTNTIPTVSLSTNLNYKLDKTLFNDSDLNQRLDFSATLSVSIPLDRYIPNSSANIQIKNGELDLEAAEINLSSAISSKKEKALSYRESFSQLLSRRKNLILHQEMAQENLNLVQEAYDHGYASLSELSSARNSLNNANSALLTNSMSFITQLCQLASAIETDFYSLVRYLQ